MKKTLFVGFLLASLYFGCDKNSQPDIEIKEEALTQIVFADQTTGQSDITFVTSGAWTSKITNENQTAGTINWMRITPESGDKSGTHVISLNFDLNLTGQDRIAKIFIMCKGSEIMITVTQKSEKTVEDDIIGVDEKSLVQTVYADQTTGEREIIFTAKGTWTSNITSENSASQSVDWLNISPQSGDNAGSYAVTISLTENLTGSDRSAKIFIIGQNNEISASITQKAKKYSDEFFAITVEVENGNSYNSIIDEVRGKIYSETIAKGEYKNGGFKIGLPVDVNSMHLWRWFDEDDDEEDIPDWVTVSDYDVMVTDVWFEGYKSGRYVGDFYYYKDIYEGNNEVYAEADYLYVDRDVTIEGSYYGTLTETEEDDIFEFEVTALYHLPLTKGWNLVFFMEEYSITKTDNVTSIKINISITNINPGGLKWYFYEDYYDWKSPQKSSSKILSQKIFKEKINASKSKQTTNLHY